MWKEKEDIKVFSSEERLYDHDLKLTGCVDLVMERAGKLWVVDFKTSYKENKEVWPLQAHFYWHLASITYNKPMGDEIIFLRLNKEGKKPKVHSYAFEQRVMDLCFAYRDVYLWRKEKTPGATGDPKNEVSHELDD